MPYNQIANSLKIRGIVEEVYENGTNVDVRYKGLGENIRINPIVDIVKAQNSSADQNIKNIFN